MTVRSLVARLLGFALVVEIAAYALSPSDAFRGAAVGPVIAAGLMIVAIARAARGSLTVPTLPLSLSGPWIVLALVGIYGMVRGMRGANAPYYVAADLFHWFFELIATAFLTWLVFYRREPEEIARFLGKVGTLVGLLAVAIVVAVLAGVQTEAANRIAQSSLVRLSVTRGFPELLYIPIVAAVLRRAEWSRGTNGVLALSAILVSFAMVVSFKRTLWLSFLGAFVMLVANRRTLPWLTVGGTAVAALGLWFMQAYPGAARELAAAAQFLAYNEAYTVEETIDDRLLQYASLMPQVVNNPMGYGFGSEFFAYVPQARGYSMVHYVHSLYVYYGLQLGIGGVVLMVVSLAWLALAFWRRLDDDHPTAWMLRTGIALIAVLLVNGLTMVSFHTAFAGFGLGLAMAGASAVPVRSTRDTACA